ncbi:ribosomal protein S18-alanine N-acetyltransferase [Psychrobium sp. 1_MG-2023]|uniref:ribosomal protein S18-alanine N-acetyltransferase n=1 Tax=Psychrobium sp. 1_MG-2023 TaxID=3062624 RepID=UPI000C328B1E|nr:ribosomal protein S18-alanine N-acetyltransferase [Psychrobium sp. 1_MG-2023]MDP2561798.1 ribosomal protein S18-alanine N-acetyltransferase [Psychrobium sp. 1_MG-2023]PKF55828.1 ribosomal-protein-alanine N-acetyltransferase [Alteromonadales bacterium alter-6D02]
MSVVFSTFSQADIDTVYPIEQAAQSHPMSRTVMESCLSKRYFNAMVLVEGVVAGFYIGEYVLDESSLIEICVAPTFQGQGLGKQLLTHYIEAAKSRGAMSCWLEVRESNHSAHKLYQSLDFNEVDRRVNYYPTETGHEDAIIMSYFSFG